MVEVSTSLLTVKKDELIKKIYNLEVAKTDYFHIDVMDGKFVEKDTMKQMLDNVYIIKKISNIPLDLHLMVNDIKENIEAYIPFEPNIITFHIEALNNHDDVMKIIKLLNKYNIKVGISIKPNTPISSILEYLPYIHMVLVMTVEPGKGGQSLIVDTIDKVRKLSKYINDKNLEVDIEVDGGIKENNVYQLIDAGANIIVAGTEIINSKDMAKTIRKLKGLE